MSRRLASCIYIYLPCKYSKTTMFPVNAIYACGEWTKHVLSQLIEMKTGVLPKRIGNRSTVRRDDTMHCRKRERERAVEIGGGRGQVEVIFKLSITCPTCGCLCMGPLPLSCLLPPVPIIS